jgi:hypothetical protein
MELLRYLLPDQVWSFSSHLAIANGGQPLYTAVLGNQIWYMKSPRGYPWDMDTFDQNYAYQSITERDWDNPRTFKMFASSSWPGANGGIVWASFSDPFGLPVVTQDSSYRAYSDCANYSTHTLGGSVQVRMNQPEAHDFGGDLGVQEGLRQEYFWGITCEVNWYVRGYGWVQWENWRLAGGIYQQQQVSAFNMFQSGGSPVPVFPCGVPRIP